MTTTVVDDDSPTVLLRTETLLNKAGFGRQLMRTGEEALTQLAQSTAPDLISTDLVMTAWTVLYGRYIMKRQRSTHDDVTHSRVPSGEAASGPPIELFQGLATTAALVSMIAPHRRAGFCTDAYIHAPLDTLAVKWPPLYGSSNEPIL